MRVEKSMNIIHNDDCMGIDGIITLPDESIDMVLCDLPYGSTQNKWDSVLPLNHLFAEYKRLTKPNAAVILFGQGMFTAALMVAGKDIWRYNLVWDKVIPSGHLNAKRMPMRSHEDILVFYKEPPVYNPQKFKGKKNHSIGKNPSKVLNNYGEHGRVDNKDELGDLKYPVSILTFPKPHASTLLHPTQKPVELCEYLIKTYTNETAVVLDNCMGSGTTAEACVRTNRLYIGWEWNKEDPTKYYNLAITRLQSLS